MIAFGTCVGHPQKLSDIALPGLRASASGEWEHLAHASNGVDIFPVYAGLMRSASAMGADALVLMHDDLEFRDAGLCSKLRAAFADPSVAIVGLIGARGVRNLRWWEADRRGRVEDTGYGLHYFGFDGGVQCDVDSVDGMMLALSPWALANLTLEGLGYHGFHGYDAELCFQARARGMRVVVADISAHHHSVGGFTQGLAEAEKVFASRWAGDAGARMQAMVRRVRESGTDSLAHFGNGYTHEGGLYLQQNPDEFAQLALLLKGRGLVDTYMEIGSASGGAARFLCNLMTPGTIISIDDGKHPRASSQDEHLGAIDRDVGEVVRFRGDSHSSKAAAFLEAQPALDVAFIDGDHSYAGVTQDIAMVLPRCKPGALVILHDTVACEGVKRAWEEMLKGGRVRKVDEFVGVEKPLGIGVAEVLLEPAAKADPWAMLREPPDTWDLGAMYDAYRGGPVSSTPCVHMIIPSYREGHDIVKLTDKSRMAVLQDLNDHGLDALRSDIDGDSLVQRMRQRAMHLFLKSNATHLLWCDLDIEVLDPACVRKMLASGHDLVAGACPFKDTARHVVCNFLPTTADLLVEGATLELPHGCLEVLDAGTGFQLVSRKAILAMMQAHPELLHWSRSQADIGEPLWALYDTGVVDGVYESEDFMFCRHWQALGGKVYVYVPATFRHYGTHGFEGNLMEQLGLQQ